MNSYPQELITPPLALVALLGCSHLHPSVGEFLRSQQRPPINSLGVTEPWAAGRLFGERKGMLTAPSERNGILKAGWFSKHRKRRPAVAVLFLERKNVLVDSSGWATSCSAMEAVKNAARARSAKMVVVIDGPGGELPEESSGAISRISAIEKKYIVLFSQEQASASLKNLGKILYEAAGHFYLDSARRQLLMHSERRGMNPERSARVHFKAAALAEFRADWATAVKTYQSSYAEIARIAIGSEFPFQRAFEIAAVAEQIHIKVVTLLLHQQRLAEAIAQFKSHLNFFGELPFEAPAAFRASHWAWVSRQYTAMGELMSSRADASSLQGDANPAFLFLWAAHAAIKRRENAQIALKERNGQDPDPLQTQISPGEYVGQFVARETSMHLTDEEFVQLLEVKEAGVNESKLAVEALGISEEVCGRTYGRDSRQGFQIGSLLAKEHMCLGDFDVAFRLLLPIAGIYRREGWEIPLAGVLESLIECAKKLSYKKEEILHCLELSSLHCSHSLEIRHKIAEKAFQSLLDEGSEKENLVSCDVTKLNHPLHTCIKIDAGFQPIPDGTILPKKLRFAVRIENLLPIDLPVQACKVSLGSSISNSKQIVDLEADEKTQWIKSGEDFIWEGDCEATPGDTISILEVILQISPSALILWSQNGLPVLSDSSASNKPNKFHAQPGLYELTIPIAAEAPRIEISSDPFGMVGETLLDQLEVFATTKLESPTIKLFGGFMESTQLLQVSMTPTDGARWISVDPTDEAEEVHPREAYLGMINLDTVTKGSIKVVEIAVPLEKAGQLKLSAQLAYRKTDQEVEEASASTEIESTNPFQLSAEFCTAPQTTAMLLPTNSEEESGAITLPVETFCHLVASIQLHAPTQVQVHSVDVSSVEGLDVRLLGPNFSETANPIVLRKGDILTAIIGLSANSAQNFATSGNLHVIWQRLRKDEVSANKILSAIPLPSVKFVDPEFTVTAETPGQAICGEPFSVNIKISNKTNFLQQLKLAVSEAQGFVISGMRHDVINLLPRDSYLHEIVLVACQSGKLNLPQCRVLSTRYNAVVEPLAGQQIFINTGYKIRKSS